MKAERIYYPTVITKPRKNQDISVPTPTIQPNSQNKAVIMATLLALSSLAQADIIKNQQTTIDPKDLTFESTSEFERNWFKNYIKNYPELKNYARVDRNTLRTVNEADAVVDHIIDDNNVHDVRVLGYTVNGNLYPNGSKIPLKEQKYYEYETYLKEKKINDAILTAEKVGIVTIPLLYLLFIINKSKKSDKKELLPVIKQSKNNTKGNFVNVQKMYGVTDGISKNK